MTGKKSFVIVPTAAGWTVRKESGSRAAEKSIQHKPKLGAKVVGELWA